MLEKRLNPFPEGLGNLKYFHSYDQAQFFLYWIDISSLIIGFELENLITYLRVLRCMSKELSKWIIAFRMDAETLQEVHNIVHKALESTEYTKKNISTIYVRELDDNEDVSYILSKKLDTWK